MRNVLEAIWWWTRVAVLAVVGAYVLALLINNSGKVAKLWYWFDRESEKPIITIIVVSFLIGGIVTMTGWALLTAMIGYRRTRDARRERLAFDQRRAMHAKAAMLRVKPQPIAKPRLPPPAVVATRPRVVAAEPLVAAPTVALERVPDVVAIEPSEVIIAPIDEPIVSTDLAANTPAAVRSDPV